MTTPLTAPEAAAGFAVDTASLERFLAEQLTPVVNAFTSGEACRDNEWTRHILGAVNRLKIIVALAQLQPNIPVCSDIAEQLGEDAELVLRRMLVKLVTDPA